MKKLEFLKNHTFRDTVDNRRSYLTKGMYENQIKLWFDVFPREQIHLLSTEKMEQNPQETLMKIFQFLEIPEYTIKNPQKQKFAKYEKMNGETREKLLDFFKPYNENFLKLLKKDLIGKILFNIFRYSFFSICKHHTNSSKKSNISLITKIN